MKRFLLLNPPLGEVERSGGLAKATGRSVPYGLLSIGAVLRQAGFETLLIDAENEGLTVAETAGRILSAEPDYLGITTVTLSIDRTAELAASLKAQNPGLTIIVGGAHVSSVPEETMLRFPAFDVGVLGEGEATILRLLNALEQKLDLGAIEGIIFRRNGELCRTKRPALIRQLDALPLPAWDLAKDLVRNYRPSAPSYVRLPSTTIVTSRGCTGRCIFCNSKAIHGGLRCFSADYVLTMIRHLVKTYGIRDLSIYDDNFLFYPERVEKICRGILEEKMDLTWACYSRVDQGNPAMFRLMKKAGCWQISYGVETGSQAILDFIKKDVTLDQIRDTIRQTKAAGLRTRGFFMIGHLTETRQSILDTIQFMKELPLDDFHFTAFTPLPGTKAYQIADEYGSFDRTWSKMNLQYPAFVPSGLSAEEMESLSKIAYKSFYFRPRVLFSYFAMLVRYPHNFKRLWNGLQALVSRILLKDHAAGRAYETPASS